MSQLLSHRFIPFRNSKSTQNIPSPCLFMAPIPLMQFNGTFVRKLNARFRMLAFHRIRPFSTVEFCVCINRKPCKSTCNRTTTTTTRPMTEYYSINTMAGASGMLHQTPAKVVVDLFNLHGGWLVNRHAMGLSFVNATLLRTHNDNDKDYFDWLSSAIKRIDNSIWFAIRNTYTVNNIMTW